MYCISFINNSKLLFVSFILTTLNSCSRVYQQYFLLFLVKVQITISYYQQNTLSLIHHHHIFLYKNN